VRACRDDLLVVVLGYPLHLVQPTRQPARRSLPGEQLTKQQRPLVTQPLRVSDAAHRQFGGLVRSTGQRPREDVECQGPLPDQPAAPIPAEDQPRHRQHLDRLVVEQRQRRTVREQAVLIRPWSEALLRLDDETLRGGGIVQAPEQVRRRDHGPLAEQCRLDLLAADVGDGMQQLMRLPVATLPVQRVTQ